MVFSSLTFLFLYLPLTLLVYFLSPLRWRNFVLPVSYTHLTLPTTSNV